MLDRDHAIAVDPRHDEVQEPTAGSKVSADTLHVEGYDVGRTYRSRKGKIVALQGVDVLVRTGEFVALLGPSGCGKSTLLKLIGGLYEPTTGTLRLRGLPVEGPHEDVGFMFQTPVLFPWLTALDNVLLPPTINRSADAAARQRARDLLALVGLEKFAANLPAELSGGMQQRVAICRMLMTDPSLLLMDEPFGALDELTRERMDIEIRRLVRAEAKTAIFVTHSLQEAVYVADRILVMSGRPGRIIGQIDVDLPGDRGTETLDSADVLDHVRRARRMLEAADRIGGEEGAR